MRAWCFVIRQTTKEPDNELTAATLDRFEWLLSITAIKDPQCTLKDLGHSLLTWWSQKPVGHQHTHSVTAGPYQTLRRFNEEWRRRRHENDEGAKLQFVKKNLGFGSSLEEQDEDELFAVLGKWQALAREASLPTEGEKWDSPSPAEEVAPPSFRLSATARSIFKALQDGANCGQQGCNCQGELLARMRVATQRRSSGGKAAHGEAFILILVDKKTGLTEVRVRTNKVAFQSDCPTGETDPINAGPLCQKLRSISSRHQRLELVLDPRGPNMGLRIDKPQDRTFRVYSTGTLITLEQLLDGTQTFEDRHKYILAVLLSHAVLHLHDTPWLRATLSPSDIYFLLTRLCSSRYYLTPFLKKQLRPAEDLDSWECLDMEFPDRHPVPTFVVLAATLLEVFMKQPFHELATKYCGHEGDPDSMERTEVLDVAELFDAMQEEIVFDDDTRFAKSIEACLDIQLWREESESGQVLLDTKLRERFYNTVVRQLEEHLRMVDNSVSIKELDTMVEAIHIDVLRPTIPADNAGLDLSCSDSEEQGAAADGGFECFDGMDENDSRKHELYKKWKKSYQRAQRRLFPDDCVISQPVRIAVLDTGLDLGHDSIPAERIIQKRNWVDPGRQDDIRDHDGHGTFVAGLLLKYAPDAELYVGKVCDADVAPSQCLLAKAIDCAIKEWKVDIVSISLGWPRREMKKCKQGSCGDAKTCRTLHDTISDAKDVLFFAAARNGGANQGVAYPASDSNVICVYSVDPDGQKSAFSPNAASHIPSIATVGGGVKSLWPQSLFPADRDPNLKMMKHKSGTSFATPIAAGMAAMLMQYARLHLRPEDARHMTVKDKMVRVLEEIARYNCGSGSRNDRYDYIHLSDDVDNFFGQERENDQRFHECVKSLLRKSF
ncbi:hypothetical protein RB595_004360 [Gaeumannomyces hyphopodioides]